MENLLRAGADGGGVPTVPTVQPTVRTTVLTNRPASGTSPRKKQYREERRALMVEVAQAVKRHHQPAIGEFIKQNFLAGVLSLLQGGYDLALIRSVALNTALDYSDARGYSKLMQIRMRVRAAQTEIDITAHNKRVKQLDNTDQAPDVRAAVAAAARANLEAMRAGRRVPAPKPTTYADYEQKARA